ncbi:uncharacterized protein A4U43_C07F30790 [Asparagus officinalis]|uniref:Uncharacterized protein n=2 Tax=Asparagus officinalis TaxID=4686 RepID=A0A5P1EG43_ASPOF|nr:uncharacterized protein A4U43_C07F30790 [Asparagus officinalis]
MAIVKRTARKRTLSFWRRDDHQIRLAFPYRKPTKLEYMTHKFKRNETTDEHISNMRNILFNMEVQCEPALSEKEKIDGLVNSLPDEFGFIKYRLLNNSTFDDVVLEMRLINFDWNFKRQCRRTAILYYFTTSIIVY